jgi:hypothetical protein
VAEACADLPSACNSGERPADGTAPGAHLLPALAGLRGAVLRLEQLRRLAVQLRRLPLVAALLHLLRQRLSAKGNPLQTSPNRACTCWLLSPPLSTSCQRLPSQDTYAMRCQSSGSTQFGIHAVRDPHYPNSLGCLVSSSETPCPRQPTDACRCRDQHHVCSHAGLAPQLQVTISMWCVTGSPCVTSCMWCLSSQGREAHAQCKLRSTLMWRAAMPSRPISVYSSIAFRRLTPDSAGKRPQLQHTAGAQQAHELKAYSLTLQNDRTRQVSAGLQATSGGVENGAASWHLWCCRPCCMHGTPPPRLRPSRCGCPA